RLGHAVLLKAGEKVQNCMDETVLVAEEMSGRPPGPTVGMDILAHDDPFETLVSGSILLVVKFQFVHVLKVERQAGFTSINVKRIAVPSPARKSRSLKHTHAAIAELRQEIGVVVYRDAPLTFSPNGLKSATHHPGNYGPLFNEGCHLAHYRFNSAVQEKCQVGCVRSD